MCGCEHEHVQSRHWVFVAEGADGVGVKGETHSIEHVTVIQQPNGYVQFSDIQKLFGCP